MAIEAVLFATGDGVTLDQLSNALELDRDEVQQCIKELETSYENENRGIKLAYVEDKIQLCSNPAYFSVITKLVQKPKDYKLSNVALETLAIIAYKQPVTKADIEKIRGVKSDYAVNQLVEYGLIEERGRLQAPGKPLLFGTTDDFLRGFGMKSIEELPKPKENQIQSFFDEAKQELNYFEEDEDNEISILESFHNE